MLKNRNLLVVFAVTLVAVMGVSGISPALPSITRALGITPQQVGLLITFYTLPGAILTPLFGVAADRYGRKTVIVPGLLLAGAAGTACAFVHDFEWLLVLRLLHGLGTAPIIGLSITVIGDLFDGPRQTAAIGYNNTVLNLGVALWPLLGGMLASVAWYWPFAMAALSLPVGLLVLWGLDETEQGGGRSVGLRDYVRGVGQIVTERVVIGLLLTSVFVFLFVFGAFITYLPELIETKFDPGSTVTGAVLTTASLVTAGVAAQSEWLSRHLSQRQLIQMALLINLVTLVLMPLVPSLALLFVVSAVFGVAQGFSLPALQTQLAQRAPTQYRGAVLSLNQMVLRLGQTLGPLLMGAVIALGPTAYVFYAGAVLAGIMLIVATVLIR